MITNTIKPFVDGRGLSVYQFQKDTKIAKRTAYDLYNTPSQLPAGTVLEKICDAYRIQPGELMEWVPD